MRRFKKQIFDIIEIGNKNDFISKAFDIFITIVIFTNLCVTLFYTFDESEQFLSVLQTIELVTILIFTVEYILRIWTSDMLYPGVPKWQAVLKYMFSFYGLIDLLTFFPYYLPFVFPAGIVAFRMLRVIRIFRLFKINAQYDAFNVITTVLKEKCSQIIWSMCLILMLMIASSLCMYSFEHEAQPDKFTNAFSGIWWSVSTLLTVGYGDIYPITFAGKTLAIVTSFLGVGMVAIPTGIISAGFVEQYTKLKVAATEVEERDFRCVTSDIGDDHDWVGKRVREITFPPQLILVMIVRDDEIIIPKGDTILLSGDNLVIGARHYKGEADINLREIIIKNESPWVGCPVRDLDISRQEMIVMIARSGKTVIPNGDTVIRTGDKVVMHSRRR